jgi:hypothetical protein
MLELARQKMTSNYFLERKGPDKTSLLSELIIRSVSSHFDQKEIVVFNTLCEIIYLVQV